MPALSIAILVLLKQGSHVAIGQAAGFPHLLVRVTLEGVKVVISLPRQQSHSCQRQRPPTSGPLGAGRTISAE